jgi:MoaA/NifB/PqqE/SkfB family radical SAM enzyme|tara:strand:+ start:269 stop:1255 length:987 start_codon:yes stop_codon:yes gene_type:complete
MDLNNIQKPPHNSNNYFMYPYWTDDVKILHCEPTSHCNADCPMCARNVFGHHVNPNINLRNLSLEWFEKNIAPTKIKNLKKVFFCGNYGDPCANKSLLDICKFFRKHNSEITLGINTNGSIRNPKWWKECASMFKNTFDYVVFSIDGLEDTNHIYRKNVRWDKLIENAKSYIDSGGSAHWDMLVFDHNKHQVNECQLLANKLGFTWFRVKTTDRWDTYPVDKVELRPADKIEHISYKDNTSIRCERDNDKSIFLDYNGQLWPCCYIGEEYYNFVGYDNHNDLRQHKPDSLFEEYKNKLNNNTPFYVCKRVCGTQTNKKRQWKKEIQLR